MSRRTSPRRVLITQNALFTFAGSETATYELAEHFSRQGDMVTVLTHGWSLQWLERFNALEAVDVMAIADPAVDLSIRADPPDLAWIHHQLLPERLLRAPGDTTFVFHHMSVAHPAEFPISHRIEQSLASAVLFPAQETLDFHSAHGLLAGVDAARLDVLGNPAPDEFGQDRDPRAGGLRRLLVVSNHIPDELDSALDLLSDVELRVRGNGERSGSISAPIIPADIDWADGVVTIGKTVQYALVAAVPVYCYDHFGGPGWLTDVEFDSAAYSNFSGRGFERKSASTIAEEIRTGFTAADSWAKDRRESMSERYLIGRKVPTVLARHEQITPGPIEECDLVAHLEMQRMQGILINVGAGAEVSAVQATDQLRRVEADLDSTSQELSILSKQFDEVVNSRTFRLMQRLNAFRHGRLKV